MNCSFWNLYSCLILIFKKWKRKSSCPCRNSHLFMWFPGLPPPHPRPPNFLPPAEPKAFWRWKLYLIKRRRGGKKGEGKQLVWNPELQILLRNFYGFLRQPRRDWIYLEKLLSLVQINFCWSAFSVLILSTAAAYCWEKMSTLMLSKHKFHLQSVNSQLW